MAHSKVPSASTPSRPGSESSRSTGSSTNTPIYTNGPNTFRVPSSHGTPSNSSSDGKGFRNPSASPSNPKDPNASHVPSSQSMPTSTSGSERASRRPPRLPDSQGRKRSRSKSPEYDEEEFPTPYTRSFNRNRPRSISTDGVARERNPFRNSGQESSEEDKYLVPGELRHGIPSALLSSLSDEEADQGVNEHAELPGRNQNSIGASGPLSDHTDYGSALSEPFAGHQPERLPGRHGAAQRSPSRHLTLLKERPGRQPAHTARSPTSPGFEWSDGAAWWHPAGSTGTANIAREIFTPRGHAEIEQSVAEQTAELLQCDYLVNILDGDGFGAEQEVIRQEVLYEFCAGGTLNKLILSRRPEAPVFGPEAPVVKARDDATYLPTKAAEWLHSDRQPAVHCAIDPSNVFFTARKPHDHRPLVRKYGLVKLGGFSKAVLLPHRLDPDKNDAEECHARCQLFEHFADELYQETGYEAPELLGMLGEDDINADKVVPGPHSDLFSIGATCFTMITGNTIWDALLERHFISRSRRPRRADRVFIQEKWRDHGWTQRMESIEPLQRGDATFFDILPNRYSQELMNIIVELLNLDPEMRGESAVLADEAEEVFLAKAHMASGSGLMRMRRLWKAMTRPQSSKIAAKSALREWREQFGPGMAKVMQRNAARQQEPLVP